AAVGIGVVMARGEEMAADVGVSVSPPPGRQAMRSTTRLSARPAIIRRYRRLIGVVPPWPAAQQICASKHAIAERDRAPANGSISRASSPCWRRQRGHRCPRYPRVRGYASSAPLVVQERESSRTLVTQPTPAPTTATLAGAK